ncbi:hypothetical protein [Latilactobacillus graminis]|uniref:Uncharacterized protein n=2 Tax=Latilactobacillus graminis TaxID=60519 RepID=A0AA89KXP3_9LACO|nr:hypothetical protein [Latilactobacillus graminis]KRM23605.1 hypothetical protein FC90_GL000069 [Latilactobacillus graminis DSM 20719]QFP80201.1 hypothetical protein LG542_08240 [Latilactobacillus graminis]
MVDFLEESRKADLDRRVKALEEQRIEQMKQLEKHSISSDLGHTVLAKVKRKKKQAKQQANENAEVIVSELKGGLDQVEVFIKGKMADKMKAAYQKENRKLIKGRNLK